MIFGDAYNGVHAIPPHLATREFFQLVSERLSADGVYLMNVISAVQGRQAELLGGMLTTLREVFPHVEVFAVQGPRQMVQNVVIMASPKERLPGITERRHTTGSLAARLAATHVPARQAPGSGVVFTDDFNPVDLHHRPCAAEVSGGPGAGQPTPLTTLASGAPVTAARAMLAEVERISRRAASLE